MEHPRGFWDSNLTDPHQHDEERAHQDLRSPDVADSCQAGHRTEHEGAQLRCATAADVLDEVPNGQFVVRSKPSRQHGVGVAASLPEPSPAGQRAWQSRRRRADNAPRCLLGRA